MTVAKLLQNLQGFNPEQTVAISTFDGDVLCCKGIDWVQIDGEIALIVTKEAKRQ